MFINAWQLHPKACRMEKAEKTCIGLANKGGVQWCGPYTNANKSGFWLYSPIDLDFTFDGENFHIHQSEDYGPDDYEIVRSLIRPSDGSQIDKWCFPGVGRTKITMGLVEKNVVQIWTGLIFETPPGWCLFIRDPVNFPKRNFEIMDAILETDWMQYDIWMNIVCSEGRIRIGKDLPIAQIIPVRRETFKEEWSLSRRKIGREDPESERVFSYWLDYNKKKFEMGGNQMLTESLRKDSSTYFKERNRMVGGGMEASVPSCPFAAKRKTIEQEIEEYKDSKPKAEFFPVFDRDKTKELNLIAKR